MERPSLHRLRALTTFLLAYVAIAVVGTALSFAIAAVLHTPATMEPMQNQAYLLSEPFLPWLNLVIWMGAAWLYFSGRAGTPGLLREARALGTLWLLVALPADFVFFVLIKSPISLSPYDYYVAQAPWIYLIYVAVFLSPLCYVVLTKIAGKHTLPDMA